MPDRDRLAALMTDAELVDVDDLLGRPGWHALAACAGVGPELFFAEEPEALEVARRMCRGCPVAIECAEAGMRERHGVWAGLTPAERRRARRRARRNRSAA